MVNYGLGYISDIAHSKKMLNIFRKVNPTPIKDHHDLYELKITMICEYTKDFDKWKPIETTDNAISSASDIEKLILNKSLT